MSLNEQLEQAGVETIRQTLGKRRLVFLRYRGKTIPRPEAKHCTKTVLTEFGISLDRQ